MEPETSNPSPIRDAFLTRYRRDLEAGVVRSLAEYLGLHPGDSAGICREYLRLESGTAPDGPVSGNMAAAPDRIGPYRLRRELGRGGQGIVWLAEDTRLSRPVALKVLTGFGPASEELLQRFRREAEVASKLDHPGICSIYESGSVGGVPYIAMRFVEGETLAQRLASARSAGVALPSGPITLASAREESDPDGRDPETTPSGPATARELRSILLLVEKTARALHAAHEAGVIHRDVKPGNIMVRPEGEPVILDFGMAREIEDDGPTLTRSGDLFGTPAYMSPEQLLAQRVRLDRRTDVYSLGVVLYECLTLRRPFEAPTREGLYQAILLREPPDPRSLNPQVGSDLRVVLRTAIEKDRERRYQTALDFAEDLRRVREIQPILARPTGPLTRLARWSRRNPALAATAAALFLSLTAFAVLASIQNLKLESALSSASRNERAAGEAAAAAGAALAQERAARAQAEGLRLLRESALARQTDGREALLLAIQGAGIHPGAEANTTLIDALRVYQHRWPLNTPEEPVRAVVLSPDGKWALTLDERANAQVWHMETRKPAFRIAGDEHELATLLLLGAGNSRVDPIVAFSPDGSRLAMPSGTEIHLWDLPAGRRLLAIQGSGEFLADLRFTADGAKLVGVWRGGSGEKPAFVVWDRDGKLLATRGCSGGFVMRVDLDSAGLRAVAVVADSERFASVTIESIDLSNRSEPLVIPFASPLEGPLDAAISPDGSRIAAWLVKGSVVLWDAADGGRIVETGLDSATSAKVRFSSDGRHLLCLPQVSSMPAVIVDAATGERVMNLGGAEVLLADAVIPAERNRVVGVTPEGRSFVWDFASRTLLRSQPGYGTRSSSVDLSADGGLAANVDDQGVTWIWNPDSGALPVFHGIGRTATRATATRNGRVAIAFEKGAGIFDLATGVRVETPDGSRSGTAIAWSQDGRRFASVEDSDTVRLWDAETWKTVPVEKVEDVTMLTLVTFSPCGRLLLGSGYAHDGQGSFAGRAVLWNAADGSLVGKTALELPVMGVYFSADSTVAVLKEMIGISRWSTGIGGGGGADTSATRITALPEHHRLVAIDPAGLRALAHPSGGPGSDEATIWDVPAWTPLRVLSDHEGLIRTGTFSPAGPLCITGSDDRTARIWNTETGGIVHVLRDHRGSVVDAGFSSDGRLVYTSVDEDTSVHLFSSASGERIYSASFGGARRVEFTDDGAWIVVQTPGRVEVLPTDPLSFAKGLEPVREASQLPAALSSPTGPAGPLPVVRLLIGCPVEGRGAVEKLPIARDDRGAIVSYPFDPGAAEKQRLIAAAGRADDAEYQLSDAFGRKLAIWWMPWRAQRAKGAAPDSGGIWVYEPVAWSGPKAFTNSAFHRVRESRDQRGCRALGFEVAQDRQAEFREFTAGHVRRPLCLIVDGKVWTAATILEPLRDQIQILGGEEGFTAEECRRLVEAFSH